VWKIAENTKSGNIKSMFYCTLILLLVTDLGGFRGHSALEM